MGTRFNSFYKDELHPFVGAMVGVLRESGARAQRPAFASYFMRSAQRQYEADIALLKKIARDVIDDRRANPSDKKDLLNAMLKGRDPKTGEALTDASIMNNMITFLIAGESTYICIIYLAILFNVNRSRNNVRSFVIPLLLSVKEPSGIPSSPKTGR
jgi:cytochrome P450 / NADPH-cytochrome P450 reductase